MRNNMFLVGNKKMNNHFIAKNKKIKDIIQSCPLAASRGLLAPKIFTLGRLGNLSIFLQKKVYVGHPVISRFQSIGLSRMFLLEHILGTSLLLLARVAERRKSYSRKSWVDEGTITILKAA